MPHPYLQEMNVPLALIDQDQNGQMILSWANEAWLIVMDRDADECISQPLTAWINETAYQDLSDHIQKITKTNSGARFVLALDETGENIFDVSLSLAPGQGASRQRTQYLMTFQDVGAEHQMRQRLMLQEQEHSKMVEHMEQFMSFAAHDLRSPMRNVQMIADLMLDDFVDHGDGKLEMIHMLDEIGEKASNTINELIRYSRSVSLSETHSMCDLSEMKMDINAILNPHNIHDLQFPNITCETDTVVLRVILQNLIDNAIKHSGLEQTRIQVDARPLHNMMIEVSVVNTGSDAMNPATIFYETNDFRGDSGFGLMGIQRLISKRGGKLESIPPKSGSGAEFRFQIPGRVLNQPKESTKIQATR